MHAHSMLVFVVGSHLYTYYTRYAIKQNPCILLDVCCNNESRILRGPEQVQYAELEGKPIFSQFTAPHAFKHVGSNLNI